MEPNELGWATIRAHENTSHSISWVKTCTLKKLAGIIPVYFPLEFRNSLKYKLDKASPKPTRWDCRPNCQFSQSGSHFNKHGLVWLAVNARSSPVEPAGNFRGATLRHGLAGSSLAVQNREPVQWSRLQSLPRRKHPHYNLCRSLRSFLPLL